MKNKCLYLYKNFVSVQMKKKNVKFCCGYVVPQTPNYIWDKPNLFANASLCLDSYQYAIIFPQSLISADLFLFLGQALIFWWMCFKIALHSFFGQFGFCLIVILSKSKDFQSDTSLKMPPSSHSMEEFGLDIQN